MRLLIALLLLSCTATAQRRVLVLYENGGHHLAFSQRAIPWLDSMAQREHWIMDYRTSTAGIDSLRQYALILQLDYPPYGWNPAVAQAFEEYMQSGRGAWVGLHHATLLGEFDGHPIWTWFSRFMGGIRFRDYIATFAEATVRVEQRAHPVVQGVDSAFVMANEEWYTYDNSPRPNVQVIASVDESTYRPDSPKKMGDHPVVWTTPSVNTRNVYIFMGHSPAHFGNPSYVRLLSNAIKWGLNGN